MAELAPHYAGRVFYIRPQFQFDVRSHILDLPTTKSWFWGGIRQNGWIFANAVLATIVVNVLALVSPMFTLAVYDQRGAQRSHRYALGARYRRRNRGAVRLPAADAARLHDRRRGQAPGHGAGQPDVCRAGVVDQEGRDAPSLGR